MASLLPAIYTSLIGLIGALIGYAIREYKNRVRPLFQITEIDGKTTKRTDPVTVPIEVCTRLEGSFFISELEEASTLGSLHDSWTRCNKLKELWPETRNAIDRVLNSISDDEFKSALGSALLLKSFDDWMLKLLINNRLDFLITNEIEQSQEVIPTWIEKDEDEAVWFDLLPQAASFGQKMGHPAVLAKCQPLIIAISRLHKQGIVNALEEYKKILEKDYNSALACIGELKKIDDEHSRWASFCFFANTSNLPVVIQRDAIITIRDSGTKTEFEEDCYLTLVDEKTRSLSDTSTPIVVKAGEGKHFALITKHVQKDMQLGTAIRESYERNGSNCEMEICLYRTGFFNNQLCKSRTAPFSSGV